MTFKAVVYFFTLFFFFRCSAPCDMVSPRLLWESHGQLGLEMVVEYPPNISAKHLAASSLMGEQREVLALIISHWNESSACVREECCGSQPSFFLNSSPPQFSNQFKQPLMKNI